MRHKEPASGYSEAGARQTRKASFMGLLFFFENFQIQLVQSDGAYADAPTRWWCVKSRDNPQPELNLDNLKQVGRPRHRHAGAQFSQIYNLRLRAGKQLLRVSYITKLSNCANLT